MKIIILNGSPRKNNNTAKMLKSAKEGAESKGYEVEYYDLYDLNFTGCRSCLACKLKDGRRNHCFWKDDLSPIIDKIFESDALIVGSPIYQGHITSQIQALMERVHFVTLSYDDYHNYNDKKINVGVILTMNAPKEFYEKHYAEKIKNDLGLLHNLNGEMKIIGAFDTLQVNDYSRYNMASFNEEHKKEVNANRFPIDLKNAFEFGASILK